MPPPSSSLLSPTFRVRQLFFDGDIVMREVKQESRKVLTSLGADIRKRAQRSMKPARRMRVSEMTPEQQIRFGVGRDARGRLKSMGPKIPRPFKSSAPGEPPRTRNGKQLRRLLYFAYDRATESVVVGPVHFGPNAARTLEAGGMSQITVPEPRRQSRGKATTAQRAGLEKAIARGKVRRRKTKPVRKIRKTVRIAARPYMTPALAAVAPRIPAQFRGMVN